MGISESCNFFQFNGKNIHYRIFSNAGYSRVALISHGILEHSGRYLEFAKFLVELGYRVYAFDYQGHGRSEGKRAYIHSFTQFIYLLSSFTSFVFSEEKKKITMIGHSMGSLIALHYLAGDHTHYMHIDRLIFSSPAINVNVIFKPFLKVILKIATRIFPYLAIPSISAEKLSRDEKELEIRRNDPLIVKRATLSILNELTDYMDLTRIINIKTSIPILALIAGDDKIVSAEDSFQFFKGLSEKNVTVNFYKESYHELFHDINRDDIFQDIKKWLDLKV